MGMPQYTVGHVRRVAVHRRARRGDPRAVPCRGVLRRRGDPAVHRVRRRGRRGRAGVYRKTGSALHDVTSRIWTETSRALFAEALTLLPGGVDSPVRAFKAVGGEPLFIERGEGPWLFDVDGNRYIDYVLSWGPLVLGHAHPRVVAALAEAASRGTSFGAPSPLELELARAGARAHAERGDDAVRQLGNRGGDERAAPGPRVHRPGQDREVRRRLPRPRRHAARAGGLGGGDARPARFSRRARGGHRGHPLLRLQRPRRRRGDLRRQPGADRRGDRGARGREHGRGPAGAGLPPGAAARSRRRTGRS